MGFRDWIIGRSRMMKLVWFCISNQVSSESFIRSLIEQDLIESFHFEVRNKSRYPTYAG